MTGALRFRAGAARPGRVALGVQEVEVSPTETDEGRTELDHAVMQQLGEEKVTKVIRPKGFEGRSVGANRGSSKRRPWR